MKGVWKVIREQNVIWHARDRQQARKAGGQKGGECRPAPCRIGGQRDFRQADGTVLSRFQPLQDRGITGGEPAVSPEQGFTGR